MAAFIDIKNLSMKYIILFFSLFMMAAGIKQNGWILEKEKQYDLNYTEADTSFIAEYKKLINTGIQSTETFFETAYPKRFSVYIYPNRTALDSTWKRSWSMPEFKSECWMVASGVADRIDMISPSTWDLQSCEHKYAEREKTQQLITHELIHVYHGQQNVSPDFNDVEKIDWFVEGLASYASGQCDSNVIAQIKKTVSSKLFPKTLDNFWRGKQRYGLSGTVAMYIDKQYGRKKIISLLKFNKKQELLDALQVTEAALMSGWEKFILSL